MEIQLFEYFPAKELAEGYYLCLFNICKNVESHLKVYYKLSKTEPFALLFHKKMTKYNT